MYYPIAWYKSQRSSQRCLPAGRSHGGLLVCDYGLWTNGTDLVFKHKLTGGLRLQPDYEDLYDLPGSGETATDNDRVLAFAVGEFSRYNLLETDVDVKGTAYEEITSSMLKSQRGQFFTLTNVIRCMIEMLNPGQFSRRALCFHPRSQRASARTHFWRGIP